MPIQQPKFFLWFICLVLFIFSPQSFFLTWALTIHLAKGTFGLIVLYYLPKTYEVIERVANKSDVDENKISDEITSELRNYFMQRWEENKCKLLTFFILNILSLIMDLVVFFYHVFANRDIAGKEYMMIMVLISFIYIVIDCVYFLWLVTLRFTLPAFITNPMKSAMLGMMSEMIIMTKAMLKKKVAAVIIITTITIIITIITTITSTFKLKNL